MYTYRTDNTHRTPSVALTTDPQENPSSVRCKETHQKGPGDVLVLGEEEGTDKRNASHSPVSLACHLACNAAPRPLPLFVPFGLPASWIGSQAQNNPQLTRAPPDCSRHLCLVRCSRRNQQSRKKKGRTGQYKVTPPDADVHNISQSRRAHVLCLPSFRPLHPELLPPHISNTFTGPS